MGPKCGCRHACLLFNGRYQCVQCRHHVSVTAETVLHKAHMPPRQRFFAFYLVCQGKRGIFAVQLSSQLGTTDKTAWYMLRSIRAAMGHRDEKHQLSGAIEFDNFYFGGPTMGRKQGRGTEKARGVVALSLSESGSLLFLKMVVYPSIKRAAVKRLAQSVLAEGSTIRSDGYRSWPVQSQSPVLPGRVLLPRSFGSALLERLILAVGASVRLS